jgi:hypothetical protein
VDRSQVKEARDNRNKKVMDVLSSIFVTAAVFHLEMSALNAEAALNAVGGCRCRGGQNPKINKIEKTKRKKATGVSGQKSSERSNNRNKRVEWTYFHTCSSPPQCSTLKCPR